MMVSSPGAELEVKGVKSDPAYLVTAEFNEGRHWRCTCTRVRGLFPLCCALVHAEPGTHGTWGPAGLGTASAPSPLSRDPALALSPGCEEPHCVLCLRALALPCHSLGCPP